MFVIEDDWHAEIFKGEFDTVEEARKELQRLAQIPWNEKPNLAPCSGWKECGRKYEIVEYDTTKTPWKFISRTSVLEVDAKGIRWSESSKEL